MARGDGGALRPRSDAILKNVATLIISLFCNFSNVNVNINSMPISESLSSLTMTKTKKAKLE